MTDLDAFGKTALYHPPSDHALHAAEHDQAGHAPTEGTRKHAAHEKHDVRDDHHQAKDAPEQAMGVLPPEDGLEFGEAHADIGKAILTCFAVECEDALPFSGGQRGDRAN